jgi:hypothetical protein
VVTVVRVQAVDEQQPGHQLVTGQRVQRDVVEPTGVVEQVEDPLDAGAVEVGDQADELLGPLTSDSAVS